MKKNEDYFTVREDEWRHQRTIKVKDDETSTKIDSAGLSLDVLFSLIVQCMRDLNGHL